MSNEQNTHSTQNTHSAHSTYSYTYSAKEQAELKKLRDKYMPEEENKLERLRRLDKSVTHKALAWALVLGIVGAIVMGAGMSLIMTDMADTLGLSQQSTLLIGVPIGVVGGVMAVLSYPVYKHVSRREREKLAPEVMRLTDELMK